MPPTLDAVAQDALVLPPEQRLALARQLLESVDLEPEPEAEAAWEAEIARRIARFKAGDSKPVRAGEVFARLRPTEQERASAFAVTNETPRAEMSNDARGRANGG